MKKLTILALCFVLIAGLMTACGGNSTADETASPSSSAATTPSTVPSTTKAPTTTAPATTTPSTTDTKPGDKGMIDGYGDAASNSGRVNRSH